MGGLLNQFQNDFDQIKIPDDGNIFIKSYWFDENFSQSIRQLGNFPFARETRVEFDKALIRIYVPVFRVLCTVGEIYIVHFYQFLKKNNPKIINFIGTSNNKPIHTKQSVSIYLRTRNIFNLRPILALKIHRISSFLWKNYCIWIYRPYSADGTFFLWQLLLIVSKEFV